MCQTKIWNPSKGAEEVYQRKKNEELVEVNNALQTITAKFSPLEDRIKKLDASFVDMMNKEEEKNMIHFVIEGNTLKGKARRRLGSCLCWRSKWTSSKSRRES